MPALTRESSRLINLANPIITPTNRTSEFAHPNLGVETSRARLGSARLAEARSCNEPSSARLAHLTSSKKRLGSARSWLASRLAEPTSLGIKLNLLSKL
jgi:hypothetical protein